MDAVAPNNSKSVPRAQRANSTDMHSCQSLGGTSTVLSREKQFSGIPWFPESLSLGYTNLAGLCLGLGLFGEPSETRLTC